MQKYARLTLAMKELMSFEFRINFMKLLTHLYEIPWYKIIKVNIVVKRHFRKGTALFASRTRMDNLARVCCSICNDQTKKKVIQTNLTLHDVGNSTEIKIYTDTDTVR